MEALSRPIEEGKDRLALLLEDARSRASCSDWGEFAKWVSDRTRLAITKDAMYKIFVKHYKVEPPARALYAITQANANILQFRNNGGQITLQEVYDILYGVRDLDGSLI